MTADQFLNLSPNGEPPFPDGVSRTLWAAFGGYFLVWFEGPPKKKLPYVLPPPPHPHLPILTDARVILFGVSS